MSTLAAKAAMVVKVILILERICLEKGKISQKTMEGLVELCHDMKYFSKK